MNKQECQYVIDSYLVWLKKGLTAECLEEACELTTPFLDHHNDHLQIYVTKTNDGKITLSDDGYILTDLRMSGMEAYTPKRQAVLQSMINGFGVKMDGERIFVDATQNNIGQRLHSLLQAMLAINDMFVMAQPRVASLFWEDVKDFLDENKIRYNYRVKLSGKSGFDHAIDFLISKSDGKPERFLQAINYPSKSTIEMYLFSVEDIRRARGTDSQAFAFLNDKFNPIGTDVIEALHTYDVVPALWSKRDIYPMALM